MKRNLFLLATAICLLASCSNEVTQEQTTEKTHVICSIDEFINVNGTRTAVDPSNNYAITWASGDAIGIFPREGYQEPFEIPAEQVGQSSATFDGGYWSLKDGLTYNAYYPFDKANFESADCKTTIPVKYTGQSQTGTTCCAGAYDYTYSDWTASANSSISFKFHHIGAFLVLTLNIPATATYTSLTLNADSEVIPTAGTYDLTANTPAFVAGTKASSLTMTLSDFSGTAGEDATFYMMMPPCDLSAATLTATLSTGSSSCTYTLDSQKIEAAHLYSVTGTPKASEVSGTVDGWVVEEHAYVDLGLPSGTLWATCNIGASKPEEYGDYFAWGEVTPQNYNDYKWSTYKWCDGTRTSLTKYCKYSSYGSVDGLNELSTDDDAAYVNWGSEWRMPSSTQFKELINSSYTSTEWVTVNGINGRKITSLTNGNSIFLPAGSRNADGQVYNIGQSGEYWSLNLYYDTSYSANELSFVPSSIGISYIDRYQGNSIRPVRTN